MNRLAAILPASNVLVDVDATSKKRVFEQAGLLFENQHAIARAIVADNLFARERLGSTGLGHAVAIPHGRIKGLKNPLAAVLRTAQLERIRAASSRQVDRADLPADAPLVAAGVGRFLVRDLAQRLGRPCVEFGELVPASAALRGRVADCAPAAAVAILAHAEHQERPQGTRPRWRSYE